MSHYVIRWDMQTWNPAWLFFHGLKTCQICRPIALVAAHRFLKKQVIASSWRIGQCLLLLFPGLCFEAVLPDFRARAHHHAVNVCHTPPSKRSCGSSINQIYLRSQLYNGAGLLDWTLTHPFDQQSDLQGPITVARLRATCSSTGSV